MKLFCMYMGLQILFAANLFAQNKQQPGINSEPATGRALYRFASFEDGKVLFRNGNVSSARLNYNISRDEMHFIGQGGDTLALTNVSNIKFIFLNGSRFYYNKGFLQSLIIKDSLVLAFKQWIVYEQPEKIYWGNAAGKQPSATINYFTGNGQSYRLGEMQVTLAAKEKYFLGDEDGNFEPASKDIVLEHYKNNQDSIKVYIKKNHTRFNHLEDLVNLLKYCAKVNP